MNAKTVLDRLQDEAPDGPLPRLATLLVDDLLDTRVEALFEPSWMASASARALRAHFAADGAEGWILGLLEEGRAWLGDWEATLGQLIPDELQQGARDLAARPYAPDRALVLSVLDRAPVRRLLRELVVDTVLAFGSKLRAPVAENPLARGLGGLGRFARDQAVSRAGALGAFTAEVVGAVSGEVEKQLERRATEFAEGAISGVLGRVADAISDPRQGELRGALLAGLLELDAGEVAAELRRADAEEISAILRRAFRSWAEREELEAELAAFFEGLVGREGDRTLRELLGELDVLETFEPIARELALRRLRPLVQGEAFARWLSELLAPGR